LDGDIQVATVDERIYHEWLVHPALAAHPNPVRVLIVGGGDGGSLRDVAKYSSVREIHLVEIDANVIANCKQFLSSVSANAFEDARVTVINKDAGEYLPSIPDKYFDAVLVDLTAPRGPSIAAYDSLVTNILRILQPDGFMSMHSGWWANQGVANLAYQLYERFPNASTCNRWIESFQCFWSFLLLWSHQVTPATVIAKMSPGELRLSDFSASKYRRSAFYRFNAD
jgi:spermidine synthase